VRFGTAVAYAQLANSVAANAANLPPLNDRQLEKLKQLSLITLASRGSEYLTYPSLLQSLELPSVRLLEDLVISAIYAGLLHAKLDTANQLVEVSSTAGRDVAPSEIASMVATLNAWSQQCEDVLADIDHQMKAVHREAVQKKKDAEEYEKHLTAKKEDLKNQDFKAGKGKRVISESAEDGRYLGDDDDMDLDDASFGEQGGSQGWASNAGRRRIKNRFGGMLGNKRR
jgi:COP9 signalosome complex subunit 7